MALTALALILFMKAATCAPADASPLNEQEACAWLKRSAAEANQGAGSPQVTVSSILDRPEFAGARRRSDFSESSLSQRLNKWLLSQFETRGAATFSEATRVLVLGFGFLAVIALLLRRRRARAHQNAVLPQTAAPTDDGTTVSSRVLMAKARALVDHAPAEALHSGYLALLATLRDTTTISRPETKSSTEAVEALEASRLGDDVTRRCQLLISLYTEAVYGGRRVDTPASLRYLDDVTSVSDALRAFR
jgi:hypothetical protein